MSSEFIVVRTTPTYSPFARLTQPSPGNSHSRRECHHCPNS